MTKKKKIIISILAVLLLLAGARYAQKSYQKHQVFSNGDFLSAEEKIYGLSVIWDTAKTYYGMWSLVPDLDWDAEYQAAIGRVLEADSLYAYYNELSAFAALLRDGHTQLGCVDDAFQTAMQSANGFWISPVSLRYMEGAFVLGGAPRSTLAQIPLGSTITEINDLPTKEYLEQEYGRYVGCFTYGRREELLAGKMLLIDEAKELTLSGFTPDGTEFCVNLSYLGQSGRVRERMEDKSLSTELKRDVTAHDSFHSYVVADSIYVAEISSFANSALPEEFAAWIDETRDAATAYILDVRGNSGGSDGNAIEVLRHFIAPADMGTMSVYKQYVDPTQVTAALGIKDYFEELELNLDLEQYYLDGLDMYAHRYVLPYPLATSKNTIVVTGLSDMINVDYIESIHIDLFNYDNKTPVTNALHGLSILLYSIDSGRTCSYAIYSKSGATGYNAYYDGVAFENGPIALTIDPNDGNAKLTIELTSRALVPGRSNQLVFDTNIYYVVEVIWRFPS